MGDLSDSLNGLAAVTGESSNGLTRSELAPENSQSQTISAGMTDSTMENTFSLM